MTSPLLAGVGAVAIVVLLCVSAFFSSSETAIFSLPRDWIEREATGEDARAGVLKRLYDDPHRLLVTLLVGNNVVNIAISSITTVLVAGYLSPGPAVVATTVLTSCLVLVFGEIVPKAYGLGNAREWALTVARPLRRVEWVLSPLVSVFDGVTRRLSDMLPIQGAIERPYLD